MPKESKAGDTRVSKRSSAGGTGATKKTRAKKDPNAPKRGLSAYMFFSQEQRTRAQQENPDATFGNVSTTLPSHTIVDSKPYTCSYLLLPRLFRSNRQDFRSNVGQDVRRGKEGIYSRTVYAIALKHVCLICAYNVQPYNDKAEADRKRYEAEKAKQVRTKPHYWYIFQRALTRLCSFFTFLFVLGSRRQVKSVL